MTELAERFPDLAPGLLAINARVVDLLPIARNRYYHPNQRGSWSIKAVLPAIARELRYDQLEGVQDGGGAMHAYLEAIGHTTDATRKREIETQLRAYCCLDTLAMVRLWQFFTGIPGLSPPQSGDDNAPSTSGDDEIGERILQNEELVQRILESAEDLSEPMTAEAFMAWLRRDIDNSPPPG